MRRMSRDNRRSEGNHAAVLILLLFLSVFLVSQVQGNCGQAPGVSHTTVVEDGNTANYTCGHGYTDSLAVQTTPTWDCVADTWIGGTQGLVCGPDCTDAPSIVNGGQSVTNGLVVDYSCFLGYAHVDDTKWNCSLKSWIPTGVDLTCIADCSDAPAVVRANYTDDGAQANYTCDFGYYPAVGAVWDCVAKTWGAEGELSCLPDCSDAAIIDFSTIQEVGVTARYTCNVGYASSGDEVWDCSGKTWTPNNDSLTCTADCSDSPNITNAAKTDNGVIADYQCEVGYHSQNDTQWDCVDKQWTNSTVELSCIADCSDSPNITNAAKTDNGDRADYQCEVGYHSQDDTQWDCVDKQWTNSTVELSCIADCSDSPNVSFSTVTKDEVDLIVTYSCNFGYYVSGDTTWNCTGKDWTPTPKLLECIADCSDAPNVTYGNYTEDGTVATYACFHGYAITAGDTVWDCEVKKWPPIDEALICSPDCSDAPSVDNATIVNNSTVQADYACNVGFNGSGDPNWDCSTVKNWMPNGQRFICADCRNSPDISNSVHYEYRARMHYRCKVGYTDYEDTTYNCLTHSWDPSNTPIVCSTECDENATMAVDTTNPSVPYGSISSVNFGIANYNNSKKCIYKLTTNDPNYAVKIKFLSFKVEPDTYCEYDSLSIYDGTNTEAPLLGQLCGDSYPATIQSTTKDMYMVFITDETMTEPGFNFTYTAVDISYPGCLGLYNEYAATETTKNFTSSGSPQYNPNTDEYWLITSTGGTLILQLAAMDVETSPGCMYDKIIIYNGGCSSFSVLDTHCGSYQQYWELNGTEYLVQFHSDSSVENAGFTMEYYIGTAGTRTQAPITTTVGPPIEVEVNLMNEVLLNYSAGTFPSRDFGKPIEYYVDAFIIGINGLDEVQQKLTTTLLFEIQWADGLISWPPSKKNNIVKLLIPQNDIWKPDIALLNGFETIQEMGAKFMYVVVDSNGTCTWRPYQIMESVCNVEMSSYPFDEQSCELKFGTWVSSTDQVLTSLGTTGLNRHETFTENSEWTLISTSAMSNSDSTVTFTLKIKRNESFVMLYIAIPIVLLSILTAFGFVLPFTSKERADYSVVVFVSFVVYLIVLYQRMPKNSEKLSNFAIYVLGMTCASCVEVIVTTLESRLRTFNRTRKRIPRCLKLFTKFIQTIQKAIMCCSCSDSVEIIHAFRETSVRLRSESDGPRTLSWPDVVSAIDFICFWVYIIGTLAATLYVFVYLSLN